MRQNRSERRGGVRARLHDRERGVALRFDWFDFTALAVGIAACSLCRPGETKDWFGSTEIVVEALIAACGFYLFLVHLLTAERRFTPSSATAASPPARS